MQVGGADDKEWSEEVTRPLIEVMMARRAGKKIRLPSWVRDYAFKRARGRYSYISFALGGYIVKEMLVMLTLGGSLPLCT